MIPRAACGHWQYDILQALACAMIAMTVMAWIWRCMQIAAGGRA